jgi:hypothetical protein
MLTRERLLLAIDIHSRSYKLLRWVGAASEQGQIPGERAEQHSNSPTRRLSGLEPVIDSGLGFPAFFEGFRVSDT